MAGFTVLDVPGHSAGHVAFWRESDRVLVLGDVLNNMNVLTGRRGLHEPKRFFTPDPEPQPRVDPPRRPRSSRSSSASATARRCATRPPLAEFAAGLPA